MKITNITLIECPACDGDGGYDFDCAGKPSKTGDCSICQGAGQVPSSQFLPTVPACECCGVLFVIHRHHNEAGVTCAAVAACSCHQDAADLAYLDSLAPYLQEVA